MPVALVITEIRGEQRELRLEGSALPTSSVPLGGDYREKVTWYPGGEEGSSQGIGPTEDPVPFTGYWSDATLGAGVAKDLVDLADSIRVTGQECFLTWDNRIRRGRLGRFIDNAVIEGTDYEWEMVFNVHAREVTQRKRVFAAERTAPSARLDVMEIAFDDLETAPPSRMLSSVRNAIAAVVADMRSGMDRLRTAIESPAGLIPGQARDVVSMIDGLESDAIALRNTVGGLQADATVMNTVRALDVLQGTIYIGDMVGASVGFVDVLRKQRSAFERLAQGPVRRLHVVRRGETLASIAMRHYGSALDWPFIARHNNVKNLELTPDLIIAIPDVINRPALV